MWHPSGTAGEDDAAARSTNDRRPSCRARLVQAATASMPSRQGGAADWSPSLSGSTIDVAAMADRYDGHGEDVVPNDVENAVTTDANTILVFFARQLDDA